MAQTGPPCLGALNFSYNFVNGNFEAQYSMSGPPPYTFNFRYIDPNTGPVNLSYNNVWLLHNIYPVNDVHSSSCDHPSFPSMPFKYIEKSPEIEDEVRVYPNPSYQEFNITGLKDGFTFEIYSMLGELVDRGHIVGSNNENKVGGELVNGAYLLKFYANDQYLSNTIIVKKSR